MAALLRARLEIFVVTDSAFICWRLQLLNCAAVFRSGLLLRATTTLPCTAWTGTCSPGRPGTGESGFRKDGSITNSRGRDYQIVQGRLLGPATQRLRSGLEGGWRSMPPTHISCTG